MTVYFDSSNCRAESHHRNVSERPFRYAQSAAIVVGHLTRIAVGHALLAADLEHVRVNSALERKLGRAIGRPIVRRMSVSILTCGRAGLRRLSFRRWPQPE